MAGALITPKMRVHDVVSRYPDTVAVFRAFGCPDLSRPPFNVMCRLMSARPASRIHRIDPVALLEALNHAAATDADAA